MKLASIDDTGSKAPAPQRGLMRAVYKTVEAIGGYATKRQIKELLPAAIDNINQVATDAKVAKSLQACVYRGFLVHQSNDDTFAVAPISYYNKRREYIESLEARERVRKVRAKPTKHLANTTRHNWWITAATATVVGAVFFVIGVMVGIGITP